MDWTVISIFNGKSVVAHFGLQIIFCVEYTYRSLNILHLLFFNANNVLGLVQVSIFLHRRYLLQ